MASNPDFYAFPTGQSGLTPAVLPTGQGLDLQPLMTAIQQRMLNKYRADQVNLDLQKLAQDAHNQESQLQFKRDALAAEGDLRNAQAQNYYSEANLHNKQAAYIETTKADDAKAKQAALDKIPKYIETINSIAPEQWGTNDASNAIALADTQFSDIGDLPGGRAVMKSAQIKQRMAANRLATDNVTLNNRYQQTLKLKGVAPSSMEYLQQDDKGNFVPNKYWGVNPDGGPFQTLTPIKYDAYGKAIGGGEVMPPGQKTGTFDYRTFTKPEASRLLQMKTKIDNFAAGNNAPPIAAVQGAVQQQNVDPNAARAQAKAKIDGGADRDAVIARLNQLGVDASGL